MQSNGNTMTINGGHPSGLFFIYGYRGARGDDGPYYVAGANARGTAIDRARELLTDRRWTRTTAKDVRSGAVLFDSWQPDDSPRPRHLTKLEQS